MLEEIIRTSLIETGILTFIIPTLLFMAMMYVFLQKSKIVESKPLAFLMSFLSSLFILAFPIIIGVDVSTFLSTFFTHLFVLTLIFFVGLTASSMFYADFTKILERFERRIMIAIMIIIALLAFVTSGTISFLISTTEVKKEPIAPEISFTFGTLALLIVFAVFLYAASYMIRR